jgi:glycosyltransferase involved in cell wall biosynthesis
MARSALVSVWFAIGLARGRYDIYHFHGGWWAAVLPAFLARIRGIPFIIKVTGLGDDDPETAVTKRVGPIPVGKVYAAPFRFASALIALNPEIARRQRANFPDVPVVSTPNGVEVERFRFAADERTRARREFDLPENGRVAVFVGHINPGKRVQELLEGWMRFVSAQAASAPPYRLLLVGPATGGAYRHVDLDSVAVGNSSRAREAGVRLLGHVPQESMPRLYAAADVFVLPTRAEGMPNSLLEALAAGLPAISSRVPGVEEILEDDQHSVLVEDVNAPGIADALNRVFASYEYREGDDRPSRLPERFALPGIADAYLRLYRALASRDGTAPERAFQGQGPTRRSESPSDALSG